MTGDEVTRVSLGGGRRRWWPYVAVGVAAWIGAAIVIGSGGGDGDAAGPTSTSTSSTTTTERPRRTTTTLASLAEQAPLLGRRTGWQLVVDEQLLDLDTGEVRAWSNGFLLATRHDGVFASQSGAVTWRPFPFEDATAVEIADPDVAAYPVAGDHVWLVSHDALGRTGLARWVSLADGSQAQAVELPPSSHAVGTAGRVLVLSAGGDGFALAPDGGVRRLDGAVEAVLGDEALVRRCDDEMRCRFVGVDPVTGVERSRPELDGGDWYLAGSRASADGWTLGMQSDDGYVQRAVLVGPGGLRPAFPPELTARDYLWAAAWTPDSEWLVVPFANRIYVVDPFADGGPVIVTDFPFRFDGRSQLAVVGPPQPLEPGADTGG